VTSVEELLLEPALRLLLALAPSLAALVDVSVPDVSLGIARVFAADDAPWSCATVLPVPSAGSSPRRIWA
jgi:hypothetical protein